MHENSSLGYRKIRNGLYQQQISKWIKNKTSIPEISIKLEISQHKIHAPLGSMYAIYYWFFKISSRSVIFWQHSSSSFSFFWIPWHKAAAFATCVISFWLSTTRVSWIKPSCKALSELVNKVFWVFFCICQFFNITFPF